MNCIYSHSHFHMGFPVCDQYGCLKDFLFLETVWVLQLGKWYWIHDLKADRPFRKTLLEHLWLHELKVNNLFYVVLKSLKSILIWYRLTMVVSELTKLRVWYLVRISYIGVDENNNYVAEDSDRNNFVLKIISVGRCFFTFDYKIIFPLNLKWTDMHLYLLSYTSLVKIKCTQLFEFLKHVMISIQYVHSDLKMIQKSQYSNFNFYFRVNE